MVLNALVDAAALPHSKGRKTVYIRVSSCMQGQQRGSKGQQRGQQKGSTRAAGGAAGGWHGGSRGPAEGQQGVSRGGSRGTAGRQQGDGRGAAGGQQGGKGSRQCACGAYLRKQDVTCVSMQGGQHKHPLAPVGQPKACNTRQSKWCSTQSLVSQIWIVAPVCFCSLH